MTATVFDTHAAVTTLRGAGFDERQAEGLVSMVRQALSEGVATKAGIKDLRSKIETLGDRMLTKEDLDRFETRMTVRFFGGFLAAVGAIVASMKLLP